jgi:hypothetical protein
MEHCNLHVTVQNNYFHNLTASHFNEGYFLCSPCIYKNEENTNLQLCILITNGKAKEEKNSLFILRKRHIT